MRSTWGNSQDEANFHGQWTMSLEWNGEKGEAKGVDNRGWGWVKDGLGEWGQWVIGTLGVGGVGAIGVMRGVGE